MRHTKPGGTRFYLVLCNKKTPTFIHASTHTGKILIGEFSRKQ